MNIEGWLASFFEQLQGQEICAQCVIEQITNQTEDHFHILDIRDLAWMLPKSSRFHRSMGKCSFCKQVTIVTRVCENQPIWKFIFFNWDLFRVPMGKGAKMHQSIHMLVLFGILFIATPAFSWTNGQSGNATTNTVAECDSPPYSTHDWIADHALDFLPDNEKAWLLPHKALYLIGTEAPDNSKIHAACGGPHRGYNDRGEGHSVQWKKNWKKGS